MTHEAKLRDRVERGQVAELVLKELEEAFTALDEDCYQTFRKSNLHDDAGRKYCRTYLRVMDDVKERFQIAVRRGEAARKELLTEKKPSLVRRIASV